MLFLAHTQNNICSCRVAHSALKPVVVEWNYKGIMMILMMKFQMHSYIFLHHATHCWRWVKIFDPPHMSWTYIKNLNGTGKTMTIHTSSYALNTLRFDDDILFSEVVFMIYNSKCFEANFHLWEGVKSFCNDRISLSWGRKEWCEL